MVVEDDNTSVSLMGQIRRLFIWGVRFSFDERRAGLKTEKKTHENQRECSIVPKNHI